METSPRLSLSYVLPQQAQKHVTVNETFRRLDALVGLSAQSLSVTVEPEDPAEGVSYILPANAVGDAWAGFSQHSVATFQDGAWVEILPAQGTRAYIVDQSSVVVFDGTFWIAISTGSGGGVNPEMAARFGVNTNADTSNKLSVKSDSVLFSYDDVTPGTGDARHIINKDAANKTSSVIFQSEFAGHAEFGLTGDNDFHLKVSSDGQSFLDGLLIRNIDGKAAFPQGLAAPLPVADGGTAATTGIGALEAFKFRFNLSGIGDNEVRVIDFGGHVYASAILAISNSLGSGPSAFFHARMAPNPAMSSLFAAGFAHTIGSGSLTGTTGPDASINFRVDEGGKFYVENRRGFAVSYTIYVFQ